MHQQNAAVAAEPGAGEQGHAFFLGGQRQRQYRRVGAAALDQAPVSGVGYVGYLPYPVFLQNLENSVWPVGGGLLCHGFSGR